MLQVIPTDELATCSTPHRSSLRPVACQDSQICTKWVSCYHFNRSLLLKRSQVHGIDSYFYQWVTTSYARFSRGTCQMIGILHPLHKIPWHHVPKFSERTCWSSYSFTLLFRYDRTARCLLPGRHGITNLTGLSIHMLTTHEQSREA